MTSFATNLHAALSLSMQASTRAKVAAAAAADCRCSSRASVSGLATETIAYTRKQQRA
jgi:hypothetical protein